MFLFFLFLMDPPEVKIDIEIPDLKVSPYHRPYVAIWLETESREGVTTIAVWHEKDEWLKDLRQWWRKCGRYEGVDGVSGATRKPGQYSLTWDGKNPAGESIQPGTYYLNFESAREEGGREFLRQKIELRGGPQSFEIQGTSELGLVKVELRGGKS